MRINRKLKIVAISGVVLVALLLLFVTAFIYDPMEGSLPDMREVVPRNVDYFVRKTDLASDFTEFPEPAFWADLAETQAWRRLASGPWVKDLEQGGFESAVEELRGVTEQIAASSGGMLDLVGDVLGREMIVAGRFVPPTFDRSRYCAYFRVSWRIRFLWGLLGWSSVRARVAESGTELVAEDDGTFSLAADGTKIHLGRHQDCLMIANDKELLDKSLRLARAEVEEDTFGQSSSYRDGIEARLQEWQALYEGLPVNALELYARPDQLFNITKWDDNWPNPQHREDMNERVLASFLNLRSWRFLSGSVLFQPGSLTALARVELNRNEHSGFQTEFFRAESAPWREWLTPFLAMVPEGVGTGKGRGACAAAALRVNAADFLVEMYEALDDRSLLDDPIRKTGKYTDARDLIDKVLRRALLPRTGFVFQRKQDLGVAVEIFEPTPAPHFAWVFWVRREAQQELIALRDYLSANSAALGFTAVKNLNADGLIEPCREFWNPHIPGTGMIAMMIYGDFFILSNSSYLALDMLRARLNDDSVLQHPSWSIYEPELPSKINGFVYVNGERLAEVFSDYVREVDEGSRDPDPSWMLSNRPRIEERVFQTSYSQYGSKARIPGSEQAAFDAAVDKEMSLEWARQRASFTAGDRARFEQMEAMCGLVDTGYLQVELDPQFIKLTMGLLFDY